jgi:uncharacterized membrane-anchored protein YhcB (DUF1043 family)
VIPSTHNRPGRAKEDASKDDNQCQIQIQRVQRNLQLGVHFAEEARSRKTSISARLVSTTRQSYNQVDNHLAKAKIIRLLVVMMEIVAKSMQTRGNLEIIRNEP